MRIAVQDIRKFAAVAGAQDGLKKVGHGVRPKITGNESNPQSFRVVSAGTHGGRRRRRVFQGETRPPLADGHSDLFGTDPIRIMQRHEITGLRLKVGGIEAAGYAQILDSRIDIAAPKLIQSKVIADYVIASMEITRMRVMGNGYVEVPQLAGDVAQHEPGYVRIRLELRGPFKVRPRRFSTDPLPLSQTFVDQFACTRCRRSICCGNGDRVGCASRCGCRGSAGRRGSLRRLRSIDRLIPDKRRTDTAQNLPKRPLGFAPLTHLARTSPVEEQGPTQRWGFAHID